MFYRNPVFYVFLGTFIAFIFMVLITFSAPIIPRLYFLHTTQAGGVRFGLWGWCLDEDKMCLSPLQLGYTWEPQIANPITKALAFYPLTVVLTSLTMISLVPVQCARSARSDRIFFVFAWISFASSFLAFCFMIGMWAVAKSRFEKRGFAANYGPLPWISLVGSLLLLAVALSPFYLPPPTIQPPVATSTRHTRHRPLKADLEASSSPRREHRVDRPRRKLTQ
ncbi:hypothetical protein B0H34DRAFT_666564 [Crassisporium funariophilum]|nr:hypothetical protein B0H34DRAFT_666564 [Crassisporium funariophilum]